MNHGTTSEERLADEQAALRTDHIINDLASRAMAMLKQIEAAPMDAVEGLQWRLYAILSEATQGFHGPEEIADCLRHAAAKAGHFPRISRGTVRDLVRINVVPNLPLREAALDLLEREGALWIDIATAAHDHLARMEGTSGEDLGSAELRQEPSNTILALQQMLGVLPRKTPKGKSCKWLIPYHRAVAIARAIGVDPIKAGV